MSRPIEQRWKDVGVEREEVGRILFEGVERSIRKRFPRIETIMTGWNLAPPKTKDRHYSQADALLPLIEKAVREARIYEIQAVRGWMRCGTDPNFLDKHLAELEAGND